MGEWRSSSANGERNPRFKFGVRGVRNSLGGEGGGGFAIERERVGSEFVFEFRPEGGGWGLGLRFRLPVGAFWWENCSRGGRAGCGRFAS